MTLPGPAGPQVVTPNDAAPDPPGAGVAARRRDEALAQALSSEMGEELHRFCYRMLGSLQDAEDATQEVLVRLWRGIDRFQGRSSLRTWAYRVATNVCLSTLRSRGRRPATVGSWDGLDESAVRRSAAVAGAGPAAHDGGLDVDYEAKETIHLALMAVLHHMPPNQRAALILRDVLGFSAREAATIVQTTPAAIASALQHARRTVESRVRAADGGGPDPDPDLVRLAAAYASAFEACDLSGLLGLLTEDVTWSMPPHPTIYVGRAEVSDFLSTGPLTYVWRHLPVPGHGHAAIACYARDPHTGLFHGRAVDFLEVRAGRIAWITSFLDPLLVERLTRRLSLAPSPDPGNDDSAQPPASTPVRPDHSQEATPHDSP